ncbi:MAG TPA: hypothetical protein DCS93_36625 [Microscillaceae bacterium]|nr:hypothetical protein [Microscillaceae bacterium]
MQKKRLVIDWAAYEGQFDVNEIIRNALKLINARQLIVKKNHSKYPYALCEKWETDMIQFFLVEDPVINNTYIVVKGSQIEAIIDSLQTNVGFYYYINRDDEGSRIWYDIRHLVSYFKQHNSEDPYIELDYLLSCIALLFDTYDEEVFEVFKIALNSSDASIRSFALTAMHYLWWDEFKPLVEMVAQKDSEEIVRTKASNFLSYFDFPERGIFMENEKQPHWYQKCFDLDRSFSRFEVRYSTDLSGIFF